MEVKKIQARTPALQSYFDDWQALAQRYENNRLNNDLSNDGKRKEKERIEVARAQVRDVMFEAFVSEYNRQAKAKQANGRALGEAHTNSLARWEAYKNSIDLETERVTRMLKNNKSEFDLLQDFKDGRYSGVIVIAWRRALGSANSGNLAELRSEVEQEYQALRATADVETALNRRDQLDAAVIGLRDDTLQAMTQLTRVFDVSGVVGKLQNLMQRIQITNLAGGKVRVEFVDSPSEALKRLMREETFTVTASS